MVGTMSGSDLVCPFSWPTVSLRFGQVPEEIWGKLTNPIYFLTLAEGYQPVPLLQVLHSPAAQMLQSK